MSIVLDLLGEVGTLPRPRRWHKGTGASEGILSGVCVCGLLGKGPDNTRETKCPVWGSGLYAVHSFSLESHWKLCLVLLALWGIYNVPVSRP